jgi:mannose-6-phosphate isomerase-like protein (cupin superfamily)
MNRRPKINVFEKLRELSKPWSPRVVGEMNDHQFKLVKLRGEFVWHAHPEADEAFFVLDGEMELEFRDHSVSLGIGEFYVVPRGLEHRTKTRTECAIMLIEPKGVANTGDAGGPLTAPDNVWI